MAKDIGQHNPFAAVKANNKAQAKRARSRDKRQAGTARQRGYTKRWERFRSAFLAAHPICEYCLNSTGRVVPANVVDHTVPHKGDPELFWPEGDAGEHFAACCKACHDGPKARAERMADRTGQSIRSILVRWKMLKPSGGGSDF